MQPHVNLGINFRKHFEPFGFSKARHIKSLHYEIDRSIKDVKEGKITFAAIKHYLKQLDELIRDLNKL